MSHIRDNWNTSLAYFQASTPSNKHLKSGLLYASLIVTSTLLAAVVLLISLLTTFTALPILALVVACTLSYGVDKDKILHPVSFLFKSIVIVSYCMILGSVYALAQDVRAYFKKNPEVVSATNTETQSEAINPKAQDQNTQSSSTYDSSEDHKELLYPLKTNR